MLQTAANKCCVAGMLCMSLLGIASTADSKLAYAQSQQEFTDIRLIPTRLVNFEVVLGRLQLSPEYFRIGPIHDRVVLEDGRERRRSVSVSVLRGKPTLQFQDHGGDETWSVYFKSESVVQIVRSTRDARGEYKVTYQQPANGAVVLKVEFEDGRPAREATARSLWHLAAEEPELFDAYLRPILKLLEPSWDLESLVAAARQSSSQLQNQVSDRLQVNELVKQLDCDVAAKRRAAAVELEQTGLAVEAQLRDSLSTALTQQQRLAINKLLGSMQPVGNDTPMRLAVWLSHTASKTR